MWMRGVWGLLLGQNIFGWLILMIPSQQSLCLSFVEEVISSVPSNWGLEHGHSSMRWTITLWVMLIYFSEDAERLGAIGCFFWLMRPNCRASSHWEFCLTVLQIVFTKALESPRLFQRKVWTQPKRRDFRLPGSSDSWTGANKSWSYHRGTKLQTEYGWCQRRR